MSCASISPAMVWIRSVVAIGRPSEVGTRSLANVTKNSCAARATPTYNPISEIPMPRYPAASRPAWETGTPGKFSAGTSTSV